MLKPLKAEQKPYMRRSLAQNSVCNIVSRINRFLYLSLPCLERPQWRPVMEHLRFRGVRARPPRRIRNLFENGSPGINRRRLAQTMVPLHAAVSSALLVTRLSISSRSSHSISRGSYKETLTHTVGLIKSRSSTRASGPFLLFLSDAAGVGSSSDLAGLKPIP
ncbi:hypothetical protein SUGI_0446960 [Cryptomeria japonica]|nr:hypothetical protein SUGI_0446960 [Cryptomeria japonica]